MGLNWTNINCKHLGIILTVKVTINPSPPTMPEWTGCGGATYVEGWGGCLPVVDDNVIAKAMWGSSNMCDTPGMLQWRGVRFAEYCWICKCEGWQRLWFVLFSPSHLKKQTNCNRMIGQFWHETYTALHSRNTFIAWCFVFFTFHFSKSDTFYTNIHNTYTCYIINWLYIRIIENTDLNRKSVKNEKYFLLISFRNWFINYFST